MALSTLHSQVVNLPQFSQSQWMAILGSTVQRDPEIVSVYLEAFIHLMPRLQSVLSLQDQQQIILHVSAIDLTDAKCDYEIDYYLLTRLTNLVGLELQSYQMGTPIRELIAIIGDYPYVFLGPDIDKVVSFIRAYLSGRYDLVPNMDYLVQETLKDIKVKLGKVLGRYDLTSYPIGFRGDLQNTLEMISAYLESGS